MINIDNNSAKSIHEQIYDEMTRLILSKALKPDEKLPSVRELASTLKINPNTIQKAYKNLESDNYIYTVKGVGNFVKNADELRDLHTQKTVDELGECIKSLIKLGMSKEAIYELVNNIFNK